MDRYRIEPGKKFSLRDYDANDTSQFDGGKKDSVAYVAKLGERLDELQDLLYGGGQHKVLVVLQGMDTSGKDGVIRKVFEHVDPLGVRTASFKVPSEEERAHDFLWRIHRQVPGAGEIMIFNRSHYEDVLVVRVHGLVPKKVWKARYRQINDFEKMLSETGTTILKFFLHIDRDEQKERLQARLDDPTKCWKFRRGDLDDRAKWDDYMEAYEDALRETSTSYAPWYVVPANAKWYRNVVIGKVLVKTLEDLKLKWPLPAEDLTGITIE